MKKETFEWIHSWCDNTDKNDLPRVLLIGDSITYGYQELVRQQLKGVVYVDFVSTSYSLDNPLYFSLIKNFVKNSKYDYIHFNFGLHGFHINKLRFFTKIKKILLFLNKNSKVGIANITVVNKEGNKKPDNKWMKKVIERNRIYEDIAQDMHLRIDDLNTLSKQIDVNDRSNDGIHYQNNGYQLFANQICKFIKEELNLK